MVLYFVFTPETWYICEKGVLGVYLWLHAFLTSALDGDEWSGSRPGRFASRENVAVTHWIGGSMGSRAGLDAVL